MQFIVFTKMFKEDNLDRLIERVKASGADGMDFTVRPGHPVTPDTVERDLAPAVARIRAAGLTVPMITANFDFIDPGMPGTEPMLRAMQQAGVPFIKLGYYVVTEGETDYWGFVKQTRAKWKKYEKLARHYGVKICCHTHSGPYLGSNAAALMHLLKGFDPACLGAYIDAGHLQLDGEPWWMGLDMVKEYLSLVAVKDCRYIKDAEGRTKIGWCLAGEGLLDWHDTFVQLIRRDYDGPVSIHAEFEFDEKQDTFDALLQKEVAFIRRAYEKARQAEITA